MARKKSYGPISGGIDINELHIIGDLCPGCGGKTSHAMAKADYRTGNRPVDSRLGARIRGKPLFDTDEEDDAYDVDVDESEGHQGGHQPRLHEAAYRSEQDFVSVEDFAQFAAEVFKALGRDEDDDADGDPEDDNEEKLFDQRGPRGTGGIPQFAAKGIRDLYRDTHRRLDVIEAKMKSTGLAKSLQLAKSAPASRGGDADLIAAGDRWAKSRGL